MRRSSWCWPALAVIALAASGCATAGRAAGPKVDDALIQVNGPARGGGGQAAPRGPAALGGFAALKTAPAVGASLPPDCVPGSGAPYQIGAIGTFGGGSVTIIPGVTVTGISGHFCAVATVVAAPHDTHPNAKVCTNLVAPADGLTFDPVKTEITIIPNVTSVIGDVTVVPSALSAYICDDGTPGQLTLDTVIQASAAPQLFGTTCHIGPLSAGVTGSFSGPLSNATATLTSGAFPVAAIQPSPPDCPQGLAQATNTILGLPLQASAAGLTITTNAQLYLAPYTAP